MYLFNKIAISFYNRLESGSEPGAWPLNFYSVYIGHFVSYFGAETFDTEHMKFKIVKR